LPKTLLRSAKTATISRPSSLRKCFFAVVRSNRMRPSTAAGRPCEARTVRPVPGRPPFRSPGSCPPSASRAGTSPIACPCRGRQTERPPEHPGLQAPLSSWRPTLPLHPSRPWTLCSKPCPGRSKPGGKAPCPTQPRGKADS